MRNHTHSFNKQNWNHSTDWRETPSLTHVFMWCFFQDWYVSAKELAQGSHQNFSPFLIPTFFGRGKVPSFWACKIFNIMNETPPSPFLQFVRKEGVLISALWHLRKSLPQHSRGPAASWLSQWTIEPKHFPVGGWQPNKLMVSSAAASPLEQELYRKIWFVQYGC